MSKQIDFSVPLSEEDAAYVADRPWLRVDAELNGFTVEVEDGFTVDDEDDENDSDEQEGDGDNADGSEEDGDDETEEDDEESDDEVEDEEEEEDDEEPSDYSDLTVEQLKDALKGRSLPVSGSKEQLIERLQNSDAE